MAVGVILTDVCVVSGGGGCIVPVGKGFFLCWFRTAVCSCFLGVGFKHLVVGDMAEFQVDPFFL